MSGSDSIDVCGFDFHGPGAEKLNATKYPFYTSEYWRRKSFQRGWPDLFSNNMEEFIKEGFFYTGVEDKVKCHKCGLLLRENLNGKSVKEAHGKCIIISGDVPQEVHEEDSNEQN